MKKTIIPLLVAAVGLTAGCANRVVLVTQSSVGLDVSGTSTLPNKVSFSFERYEATIVPRKTNGEANSVYGGMDADMTWFHGHAIKQVFATGEAAKLATGGVKEELVPTTKNDEAPLIFLTATTYGLNIAAGEQSMPPNLLLGYRRLEAAVIPIPDPAQEVRSVYADIQISSKEESTAVNPVTTNFSSLGGVRIKQSFATGSAAETLAKNPAISNQLAQAAGLSAAAQKIYTGMINDLNSVMAYVVNGDTVDAGHLQTLITDNGQPISGTEDWLSRFGGKPAADFKKELVGSSNYLVPQLAKKINGTPPLKN